MLKVCSSSLLVALALAGCNQRPSYHKPKASPVLLIGAGAENRLIQQGFNDQLAVYHIESQTREARTPRVVAALMPEVVKTFPSHVIIPSASADIEPALVDAFKYSVNTFVIGIAGKQSKATARIAADPEQLAREIERALLADFPKKTDVTIVESPSMVDVGVLEYELRRRMFPPSRLRYDDDKPQAVVAIGSAALARAFVKYPDVPVYAVDAGEAGEKALERGTVAAIIEPNWYVAGVRAARLVRDTIDDQPPAGYLYPVPIDVVRRDELAKYRADRTKLPPPDQLKPLTPDEEKKLFPPEKPKNKPAAKK